MELFLKQVFPQLQQPEARRRINRQYDFVRDHT
jgi:hypothetical protein